MSEVWFVLSLFGALVWVIVRAVLMVVRIDAPGHAPAKRGDPIASYVEENYGTHFCDATLPVNQNLRNL